MSSQYVQQDKTKILITGGSGFLGGYLIQEAYKQFDVTATYFKNFPLFDRCEWLKLSLSNQEEIERSIKNLQPNIIIHNAALSDVDYCEKEKDFAIEVNTKSSEQIARIANEIGARAIYISTDLVFDGTKAPYSETDRPMPLSHYAWSKWQGEEVTKASCKNHVIIRPAIMFGPPAIMGTSFSEWMINSWKARKPTMLFSDQYRTPIFAGNLAAAIIEISNTEFIGTLHIGGAESIARYHFGLLLSKHLESEINLVKQSTMTEVGLVGKRPTDVSLNIELAKKLLQTKLLDCKKGIQKAYPPGQISSE